MLKQWEKRVIVFQFIYSCLMKEKFDLNDISDEIKNNNDVFIIIKFSIEEIENIKKKIIKHINKNWTWDRISDIDKAILISSYAEFNTLNIKKNIIIDQAIITSKNYSDENSYKFINSILERILNAKV